MMEIIFLSSLALLIYPVIGYPLTLLFLSGFRKHRVVRQPFPGKVSVIITAYNEERKIEKKLENTLNQDFPADRLEIIVASDCSSDATDQIVRSFAARGVALIRPDHRGGKEYAQKCAVEKASGDVLVFSDVGTMLEPSGISRITSNFVDSTVGCVSSHDRFINPAGRISGEGLYVRYEMFLRMLESRVNSLVGLSGSFFAARANISAGIRPDTQSDFQTLLNAIRLGYRGVADSQSIGYYHELASPQNELNRKMRTVLRGITTLMSNGDMLIPWKYGLFSFQLISHKLLRWLVPTFLLLIFASSVALASSTALFKMIATAQIAGYLLSFLTLLNRKLAFLGPMRLLRYGLISNIGILIAWLKFLRGEKIVFWEPSKR